MQCDFLSWRRRYLNEVGCVHSGILCLHQPSRFPPALWQRTEALLDTHGRDEECLSRGALVFEKPQTVTLLQKPSLFMRTADSASPPYLQAAEPRRCLRSDPCFSSWRDPCWWGCQFGIKKVKYAGSSNQLDWIASSFSWFENLVHCCIYYLFFF